MGRDECTAGAEDNTAPGDSAAANSGAGGGGGAATDIMVALGGPDSPESGIWAKLSWVISDRPGLKVRLAGRRTRSPTGGAGLST
jgi:hypothetical protein